LRRCGGREINARRTVAEQSHIKNLNFVTFWHEPTMAMLEARGMMALNQPIRSERLLGKGHSKAA
jgi:hypothetical protein